MIYQKVAFHNFRNFSDFKMDFHPGINIFIGQNGQGKTNLLEGLFLLTQGESFRYGDNETFIYNQSQEAILRTQIKKDDLIWDIKLQVLKSRKNHFANEKKITASTCSEKFPVIIFSPESLSAIKEGDDQRRQLVDALLITTHPGMSETISDYRRVLKSRNKLLKNHLEGLNSESETRVLLESINPIFLQCATALTLARIEALNVITPDLNFAMKSITSENNVDISVEYVISGQSAKNYNRQMVYDSLHKRIQELSSAELASGNTLTGPHKHDIKFLYNQNDSRFFCSQGQQRVLILSFKMAQIVYHRRVHKSDPVLMLDDVLSELDFQKRSALISFLKGIGTQIFISTTEMNLPAEMRAKELAVYQIAQGKIIESCY